MQRWLEYGFLSFRWWLMLVILVLPWMLCAKAADRIKLPKMLLFGDFIGIFTILLDRVGYYVDFWDYPTQMFPLVPGAWPFDLSIVPVAYMLIHQYFRTWKLFLYAILGMAAVNSFIGEPLSNRMDPVVYYRWKPVYSFFVYLVFGIGTRALVEKLKPFSTRHQAK